MGNRNNTPHVVGSVKAARRALWLAQQERKQADEFQAGPAQQSVSIEAFVLPKGHLTIAAQRRRLNAATRNERVSEFDLRTNRAVEGF